MRIHADDKFTSSLTKNKVSRRARAGHAAEWNIATRLLGAGNMRAQVAVLLCVRPFRVVVYDDNLTLTSYIAVIHAQRLHCLENALVIVKRSHSKRQFHSKLLINKCHYSKHPH